MSLGSTTLIQLYFIFVIPLSVNHCVIGLINFGLGLFAIYV